MNGGRTDNHCSAYCARCSALAEQGLAAPASIELSRYEKVNHAYGVS